MKRIQTDSSLNPNTDERYLSVDKTARENSADFSIQTIDFYIAQLLLACASWRRWRIQKFLFLDSISTTFVGLIPQSRLLFVQTNI